MPEADLEERQEVTLHSILSRVLPRPPTMSQRLGSAASCDKRAGQGHARIPPDFHRRARAAHVRPRPRVTCPAGLASSALIVWRPGFHSFASFVASIFSMSSVRRHWRHGLVALASLASRASLASWASMAALATCPGPGVKRRIPPHTSDAGFRPRHWASQSGRRYSAAQDRNCLKIGCKPRIFQMPSWQTAIKASRSTEPLVMPSASIASVSNHQSRST